MELVFNGKYRLGRKRHIPYGKCLKSECACTDVITMTHITVLDSGTNIITTKEEVAIKLECKQPQLHIEAKFYKTLQSGG